MPAFSAAVARHRTVRTVFKPSSSKRPFLRFRIARISPVFVTALITALALAFLLSFALFGAFRSSPPSNISAVVLFHGELEAFQHALQTWHHNGLLHLVDEVIIFVNGASSHGKHPMLSRNTTPHFFALPYTKRRIIFSPDNLPLGLAISRMVRAARSDYVLLLEKDWALIEDAATTQSRLLYSKQLLHHKIANVVRFRHRHNPGVPLHALIMHYGREQSILSIQKNLLCYVHHWQSDPPSMFPGKGRISECPKPPASQQLPVQHEDYVYCASSEYCQWTNNPALFGRKWFINNVLDEFEKQYKLEHAEYGDSSPFLDFEYYTNWRSYAWADKNFTVALGTGLFSHDERQEQKYFNTFWYAHYRLTVDLEELRDQYLQNETSFKAAGGVHYDPESPYPLTLRERYPVEFVRKYQWPDVYTGSLNDQRSMINDVYAQFLKEHRVLPDEDQNSPEAKEKSESQVPWRSYVTNIHFKVEKAMLLVPPEQPHEMNITLVTSLLDIGRSSLDDDEYQFRRDFQMYLDAAQTWLTHQYPKVMYTTRRIADELRKNMSEEAKNSTVFEYTTREELRTRWLGPDNFDLVQRIRNSSEWLGRASWLANSPQAGLEDYNPLVMSKMFMMRHAARTNHWNTTHFLFVDAKHNCQNPRVMNPKNDHIIRAHMFDKLLMTHFDYTPSTEVHGFEYSAFNKYCNMENATERQNVKVGRGGVFGGSRFVLEYIAAIYDVILTATLREGLMGTEENIFSIIMYQVPQYVDGFNNNWACPDNVAKDHYCKSMRDHQGYNCAIFDWVARNAVATEENA